MTYKFNFDFKVGDIVTDNCGWTGQVTQVYKDGSKFDGFEMLLLEDGGDTGELVGKKIEVDAGDSCEFWVEFRPQP